MGKTIVGVITGIVTALLVVGGIEWLGHQIYPIPEGLDPSNKDAMRDMVAGLPTGAILMVGFAWMAGAFCGSYVTGRIGSLKPHYGTLIVTGLILAGTITNLILIPHPLWFSVSAPIAVILSGYAATWLLKRSAK